MKNYKIKSIKPFKSLKDEANFWDSHDVSKVFKKPKVELAELDQLESEKKAVLTIRLQRSIKEKIEKIAKIKGINTGTLSRMWLIEKLKQNFTSESSLPHL